MMVAVPRNGDFDGEGVCCAHRLTRASHTARADQCRLWPVEVDRRCSGVQDSSSVEPLQKKPRSLLSADLHVDIKMDLVGE